jgi:hypothetical protein
MVGAAQPQRPVVDLDAETRRHLPAVGLSFLDGEVDAEAGAAGAALGAGVGAHRLPCIT